MGGLINSVLGICCTNMLDNDKWCIKDDKIKLKVSDVPELAETGGAVYLTSPDIGIPVLVLKSQKGEYLAFANHCQHLLGRRLDPVPGEDKLRCCSLLHSEYDLDGKVVKGPANKPVKKYKAELDGDILTITIDY